MVFQMSSNLDKGGGHDLPNPLTRYRRRELTPHRGAALLVELDLAKHRSLGWRQGHVDRLLDQGEQLDLLDLVAVLEVVDVGALRSAKQVLSGDFFTISLVKGGIQGWTHPLHLCPPKRVDRLVPRDPDGKRPEGSLALEVLGRHGAPRLVDHIPRVDSSASPHTQDGDAHESPDPLVFLAVDPIRQLGAQWLVIHVKYLSQDCENRKRK